MPRILKKDKLPENKPLIMVTTKDYLDPEKYNIINYVETFRQLGNKPMWLGRDWASLRAYQMFCHMDLEKCGDGHKQRNICGYSRSVTCGLAWKHKDVAIRKSAQSRWSEFCISLAAFLCDVFKWDGGYYMPSEKHLLKWAPQRVHLNLVKNTPRYEKICEARIDKLCFNTTSFLYLFGLNVIPASFALNFAILDEYAEVNDLTHAKSVYARFNDKAESEKLMVKISTPRIPGRDISADHDEGTRHEWHIQCKKCKSLEQIGFMSHVNRETLKTNCLHCGHEINRLSDGLWIAQKPEAKILSLQYEKMYTQVASMKEIVEESKSDVIANLQSFYWHSLGRPFITEGSEITEEMIKSCYRYDPRTYSKKGLRTAGVDVGNCFDIRVSDNYDGRKYLIAAGTLPYPEENKEHGDIAWNDLGVLLFDILDCDIVVVDNLPRHKEAKKFAAKYIKKGKKVYRFIYDDSENTEPLFVGVAKDPNDSFVVYFDRTCAINEVQHQIAKRKIWYPEGFTKDEDIFEYQLKKSYTRYIQHMTSVHRKNIAVEKKEGKDTIAYTEYKLAWVAKNNDGDHQLMAEMFDTVAGMYTIKNPKLITKKEEEKTKINEYNRMIKDFENMLEKHRSWK